ncbi:MAG TPA: aldo/keto reductase [Jatrophihabitans sp.]|jgi:aryl-alcohol dehydrogenase-like predicted oxidoreductase|uniref:aldo/keto reductase n=1 Tax=Jatrophihabitans sp. TaxID=1932789 RepID=UPI002F19B773
MPQRAIAGREVGAIGLGCMPMSWFYDRGARNDDEATATIQAALDHGVTLLDTADVYGPFANESLLGRALAGRREKAFLATKVGLLVDGASQYHRNGSRAHIHGSCEASLRRLRTEHLDLYQLHRVDPAVPVEDSVAALAELVQAGKIRAIGLSEVSVDELGRAARIAPIASVQSEFSLWTRDPARNGVLRWCEDNGAALLAYAPLGRGYLTGAIRSAADLPADDWRRDNPRFQPAALRANESLLAAVLEVAERVGASAAQVALRWLLGQSRCVLPIPGTRRPARVIENARAALIELSEDDARLLDGLSEPAGARY